MRHFNRVSFIYTQLAVLITLMAGAAMAQTDFWQQTDGPFGGTIESLAVNSNGDIFAGTRGGGVFRSTDNGDNWSAINTSLTNTFVPVLAIHSNGDIFAGTFGGVFRSTDNGDTWSAINTGLTNLSDDVLAINSSGDIFVGTEGGGVFPCVESTTVTLNFTVTNTNASGAGSLRDAVSQANASANADDATSDSIKFDIPDAGPHVIALQSFENNPQFMHRRAARLEGFEKAEKIKLFR